MGQRTVTVAPGRAVPYPAPTTAAASRVGKGNRRTDTTPEVALRSELHRRGLRFRKDHLVRVADTKARVDICFPRVRVAVFVDGCFWHRCPEHGSVPNSNAAYWGPKLDANVERDRRVTSALEAAGWVVVRAWEHVPVAGAADRIEEHVRAGRERHGGHRV